MKIRSPRRSYKPRPLNPLGERLPELTTLRDRLVAQTNVRRIPHVDIVTDDVPESYLRLIYGLPDDRPVWSRVDALRQGGR